MTTYYNDVRVLLKRPDLHEEFRVYWNERGHWREKTNTLIDWAISNLLYRPYSALTAKMERDLHAFIVSHDIK